MNATRESMKQTGIYQSDVIEVFKSNIDVPVIIEESTTFSSAKKYADDGNKVAVLNFASAVNPCGDVTIGAMTQEEYLCRSSNLAPCLKQKHLFDEFYMKHRNANDPMYSNTIIYSKNVLVFKNDDAIPVLMDENDYLMLMLSLMMIMLQLFKIILKAQH